MDKSDKLGQQNEKQYVLNILQGVDTSFNCFQHFVLLQNVENNILIDYQSYSLIKIE